MAGGGVNGMHQAARFQPQEVDQHARLSFALGIAELVNEVPDDEHGEIYDFEGPRRNRRRHPYSHDEIVAAIKAWERIHGRPPMSPDWNPAARRRFAKNLLSKARWHLQMARYFEEGSWPSVVTVRDRFGSLNCALMAAGFEPRSPGRQPRENAPIDPIRQEANQIARAEIASEARFRHLVRRLLEAKQADDQDALRACWYELAEVAVVLGDRVEIPEEGPDEN